MNISNLNLLFYLTMIGQIIRAVDYSNTAIRYLWQNNPIPYCLLGIYIAGTCATYTILLYGNIKVKNKLLFFEILIMYILLFLK